MKRQMMVWFTLLMVLIVPSQGVFAQPAAQTEALPQEVIQAMTAGIMDEYHAYAVYQGVIDQFGRVRPFTNIQRAEAQHIRAWELIFERYGVPIPESPQFDVPTFTSLSAACETAAQAETDNKGLYDSMSTTLAAYPDMVRVVTNLKNVSEFNHLPAFERCSGR